MIRYLNNNGDKWIDTKISHVMPLDRYKKDKTFYTEFQWPKPSVRPLKVKYFEQYGNYAIARFSDNSYSINYKVL